MRHRFEVSSLDGANKDLIWQQEVSTCLPPSLSRTVKDLLFYGFTELIPPERVRW